MWVNHPWPWSWPFWWARRGVRVGYQLRMGTVGVLAAENGIKFLVCVSHNIYSSLLVTIKFMFFSLLADNDIPVLHTLKWELELQAVYCKMTEGGAPSAELSAKLHHWGTVFYLGMLIIKVIEWNLCNSLALGRCGCNLILLIFKLISKFSWEFPVTLASGECHKNLLVQVMTWCFQATSHYLSQCWPRSVSPYGATRPQWDKMITESWSLSRQGGYC